MQVQEDGDGAARGAARGEEAKRTALNTRSSTRPTGTLFPCKFCLLSGAPFPFPPSISLPPARSHPLAIAIHVGNPSPSYPRPLRFSFARKLSRKSDARRTCAHLPLFACTTHIHPHAHPFSSHIMPRHLGISLFTPISSPSLVADARFDIKSMLDILRVAILSDVSGLSMKSVCFRKKRKKT